MLTTSPTIKAISTALLKFQGAVDGVGKNSVNPGFKSRYANLETVVDTARPELQAVGVVFLQSGGAIVDGVMAMTTRLIHADSGEWIEGTMDIALGKRDPQGVGSAQTYAQRYHLMAMLGLPPVDDDGEAAMDRSRPAQSTQKPTDGDPEVPAKPASKMKTRPLDGELRAEMDNCTSSEQLDILWHSAKFKAEVARLPNDWQALLQEHYATAMTAWANNAAARDEIIASLKAATSLPDLKERWEAKATEIGELPESMFKQVDTEKETMKKAVRAAALGNTI